jgi:hypothetical protein
MPRRYPAYGECNVDVSAGLKIVGIGRFQNRHSNAVTGFCSSQYLVRIPPGARISGTRRSLLAAG